MPHRVAVTNLDASTIDIINTIRSNASLQYQNLVPTITTSHEITQVGEIVMGYPALANEFCNALINRIAMVMIRSSLFNNPFERLKKGFLDFGESIEEIFVGLANVRAYSSEKAEQREFKRTLPDVRSAFHVLNWRVQYPVTIEDKNLRQAFLSESGMYDLITKIVDSLYKASYYDEYLLFKYLLIKGISSGSFYPVSIGDLTDMHIPAEKFRGMSNKITFLSTAYNSIGVQTNTPRENQYIFMDAEFNAKFDVEVLAGAFNMEKADFMGRLILVDDWNNFDNERFTTIRAESDMIEEVTSEELALMADVKAVLIDESYFQVYDNLLMMTETPVASGLYRNYFLNTWKIVSYSPFANAIVFATDSATITAPETLTFTITSKVIDNETGYVTFTLENLTDRGIGKIEGEHIYYFEVNTGLSDTVVRAYMSEFSVSKSGIYTITATGSSTASRKLAYKTSQALYSSGSTTINSLKELAIGSTLTFTKQQDINPNTSNREMQETNNGNK